MSKQNDISHLHKIIKIYIIKSIIIMTTTDQ